MDHLEQGWRGPLPLVQRWYRLARHKRATAYVLTAGSVGVVTWIEWIWIDFFGYLPGAPYAAMIAVAAWLGGLGPAVCAFALAQVGFAWLFVLYSGDITQANSTADVLRFLGNLIVDIAILVAGTTLSRRVLRARRQFEHLDSLVRDCDEAIFSMSPDGLLTTANPATAQLLGYSLGELIGQPMRLVLRVGQNSQRHDEDGWRANVLHGASVRNFETQCVRKDGVLVDVAITASAIRDDSERPIGLSLIMRDMTERKRADEERRARERAEEAVRLREEFLSIAAHELKTPLTSLHGYAQLLAASAHANTLGLDRLEKSATAITNASRKLNALIEQLLDVTRIEMGRLLLRVETQDLAALVREVLDSYTGLTNMIDARLRPAVIQVDPIRMEQVVRNLIDNACKYGTPPIIIEVFEDAHGAWLIVRDYGPGVTPEQRPFLFDRFYQADLPAKSLLRHAGLGIGLWVTRNIVDQHGGSIRAEFPPEGGTRMLVRLPSASSSDLSAPSSSVGSNGAVW